MDNSMHRAAAILNAGDSLKGALLEAWSIVVTVFMDFLPGR